VGTGGSRARGARRRRWLGLLAALGLLAVVVPAVLAATPNRIAPGQRVDAKVLLISADGTEAGFGAWKAQLAREGVPYDTFVAYSGANKLATLTDDKLADYGANRARYSAVILATGDLVHNVAAPGGQASFLTALTDAEWSALAKFERTFGIRQLSDFTAPGPAHGLTTVATGPQDGIVGTLTTAGKAAFPYLKGPVPIANDDPIAAEAFGYQATPVNAQNWQTLVAGPNNTAYLGIYTHPDDGREEMVVTVASNENQVHAQLLRHGELNWVTRGVFLGYQRNYLELQVDDLFLGDDAWDPATHTTNYDPLRASRMTPGDVAQAVTWSKSHGVRLDFAFNGGGSEQYKADNPVLSDPLADAFANPATRGAFGWINHTYEHPNLDCSTASFINRQIALNVAWGQQRSLPLAPTELVTGEHSGLANSRPGNPGTIDPPSFSDVTPTTGGTLAAGSYEYAVTAQSAAGETTGSTTIVPVPATGRVTATFNAVCHAVAYNLYRRLGTGAWSRVGTLAGTPNAATDNGTAPVDLSITDTGAAAPAAAPPAANNATLAPYGQNPNFLAGLGSVAYLATDASKSYPTNPAVVTGAQYPAGATFTEGTPGSGGFQAVPRYPSNVYYNASKQGQQLDEYNWIYVLPANGGGCVPITGVTTCRTTPATWTEYVTSENSIMFRHVMGNDPRPHYMHQSNLADWDPNKAETDPTQGGILYPMIDGLLGRYETYFDRASEPLVQLTTTQIAATLAQQNTWAANLAAGRVSAWLQNGELHVKNNAAAAIDVPLTGTTVGELYGGQRSGWTSIAGGAERVFAPNDPANTARPDVSGSARVGGTLTATKGSWSGTPTIEYAYQWQRCDANGANCANIAGATATTYQIAAGDDGARLRVVVSAGNWISSVSQAASPATSRVGEVAAPGANANPGANGGGGAGTDGGANSNGGANGTAGNSSGGASARLSLTKVTMSPRRFAVAHKRKRRGTRLDGSRITWKLNRAATVQLVFQRLDGSPKHRRWVRVGTMRRAAKKGTGVVRFTGRLGKRGTPLRPRSYRLVAMATTGRDKTSNKHVTFRVVNG
jgi:hypothetical protein